jgi:hypothetical protein
VITPDDILAIIPAGKDPLQDPSRMWIEYAVESCKAQGLCVDTQIGPNPMENRLISFRRAKRHEWYLWLDADDELAPGCVEAFATAVYENPQAVFFHGTHQGEASRAYNWARYQKMPGITGPYLVSHRIMERFLGNAKNLPVDGVGLNYAYFREYLKPDDVVLTVPNAMLVRRYHQGSISVRERPELIRRIFRYSKGRYD